LFAGVGGGGGGDASAVLSSTIHTNSQVNELVYTPNGRYVLGGGSSKNDGYKYGMVKLWEVGASTKALKEIKVVGERAKRASCENTRRGPRGPSITL